jgi:D-alanyl-D-alanine carboxypeptidase
MCRFGHDAPPKMGQPDRAQGGQQQGSCQPGVAQERAEIGEITIMRCVPVGARRGLRWGCLGLAAVVALLAVTSDADARQRRKRSKIATVASSYNPPYAAIVVDARNGAVLHAANPDAKRFPASLTKVMTLYLLFERLEAGKISLDTQMPVSEEASMQAPTKLGLKPGDTLKVEDAIKGLVTKSANDASVVVAEALAGDEDEFARMMTRKARALGMRNTTYKNANGLPNEDQITTARDQALLGIAIQERFPKYYRYFSLASFVYRGHSIRNHNRLLGQVEGVDGIKTGFTRDSGFNLLSSVKRGPRQIVAVVLGGRSAASRDARMRSLIAEHIDDASTKSPAAPVVASASEPPKFEAPARPQTPPLEAMARSHETTAAIAPGSTAPLTPVKVKTVTVRLLSTKHAADPASAAAKPEPVRTAAPGTPSQEETLVASLAAAAPIETARPSPPPLAKPAVLGKFTAREPAAPAAKAEQAKAEQTKAEPAKAEHTKTAAKTEEASIASAPSRRAARSGWVIQVGAYEDESEAKQHLSSAKSKVSGMLQKAEPYIERTVKGGKTYYRARFAGFDHDQAEALCKRLKREDIVCMAVRI